MSEEKQARLVERWRNLYHGGPCELWGIGGGRGIYVSSRPFVSGELETVAFPVDWPAAS